MTPLYLYGISGWRWQKVPHISIFPLYHLRRLVLLSPRIIPPHSLGSYMWNADNCLIGHHQRGRFQTSGHLSYPLHSRQMASTSSQAPSMEELVCRMLRRERHWQAVSVDIVIGSTQWRSRPMASASSQVQGIEQFVCGMPQRESQRQALSQDTEIGSILCHSRQMVSTSSQLHAMEQFVCGMP
jgi:hypothetical protein